MMDRSMNWSMYSMMYRCMYCMMYRCMYCMMYWSMNCVMNSCMMNRSRDGMDSVNRRGGDGLIVHRGSSIERGVNYWHRMSRFIHRWGHHCMGLLTKITHCHNFTPAPPSWVRSCCALNKMPYV